VERFADLVTKYRGEGTTEPVVLECALADFALSGTLQRVAGQGLVHYRYGRITPRDRVNAWIRHLALQTAVGAEGTEKSVLLGLGDDREPAVAVFAPLGRPEAEAHLHTLFRHYWQGLARPLHFFPRTSWEYAQLLFRGKPDDEALETARQKWQSDEPDRGDQEGLDPYHQLCFGEEEVLDREFKSLAREILMPLLGGQDERRET
jgi:exodeoxyribonuclease V gamma subunit